MEAEADERRRREFEEQEERRLQAEAEEEERRRKQAEEEEEERQRRGAEEAAETQNREPEAAGEAAPVQAEAEAPQHQEPEERKGDEAEDAKGREPEEVEQKPAEEKLVVPVGDVAVANAAEKPEGGVNSRKSSTSEPIDPALANKEPGASENPHEDKAEELDNRNGREEQKEGSMKKLKMGQELMDKKKKSAAQEPSTKTCGNCMIF